MSEGVPLLPSPPPPPPPYPPIPPEVLIPITPEEVCIVTRFLTGRGWMTSRELAAAGLAATLGLTSERYLNRKLRAITQYSEGAILSFQGSPGYRLTAEATEEEVDVAIATLRHAAGEMQKRAVEIERAYLRSR